MTRNQIVLIAALVVLLLAMALVIITVSESVVGMMTPHPTWTAWASPTQEGSVEPTREQGFPTATPFGS